MPSGGHRSERRRSHRKSKKTPPAAQAPPPPPPAVVHYTCFQCDPFHSSAPAPEETAVAAVVAEQYVFDEEKVDGKDEAGDEDDGAAAAAAADGEAAGDAEPPAPPAAVEEVDVAEPDDKAAHDVDLFLVDEDGARRKEMVTDFVERASTMYYARIQSELLAGPDDKPLPRDTALMVATVSLTMIASMLCMTTVRSVVDEYMEWEDDAVFGFGNRPYYTVWTHIWHLTAGIPIPTAVSLMMVVVMATLSTVERLKDDHVICCLIARELLNRRRYATRVFLCAWIHVLRICLTISYLNATTFLIGSADGPLNIMLNALAIGFLLEFEATLADCSWRGLVPYRKSVKRRFEVPRELFEGVVDDILKVKNAASVSQRASRVLIAAIGSCVATTAWLMQERVADGRAFHTGHTSLIIHGFDAFVDYDVSSHALVGGELAMTFACSLAVILATAPVLKAGKHHKALFLRVLLLHYAVCFGTYTILVHVLFDRTILVLKDNSLSERHASTRLDTYGKSGRR